MAFTYDITTDRGRVRLNLADTTSTAYAFEDAEIDQMLTDEGSVGDATAALIRVLLMDKARRVKRFAMQGLTVDDTAGLAELRHMLSVYGGDTPTLQSVMPRLLPMDAGYDEVTIS